ncbi:uncharacterized protein MONOS_11062 [Monocercomonoides exilis]|uniref:uncharacterized protein n=1 Tax=Monocercomonoides exilis TaxID=2049356 RepID=UPI00355A94E9|nr:hypothetical protein MONOS_11062 [Monocercomonoides exilis]|eukprot:MONOS_11062.1-p1 / transcript=MONOS_11062.1 / gene=MONOS_11062 / organism=Monocercomonoides_exilis_PA203 / gene_product=unspecified product / transcript_product=unspecified product / location=Mono_scaffold00533:42336-42644(-) / protein_length=84 / sequence_SO=supercontig / SO=protein_coding / is_pseudo=false
MLDKFVANFRAPIVKKIVTWGCTTDSFVGEEDILLMIVKYQSEKIFVSSVVENVEENKQCGVFEAPCESLNEGMQHIIPSRHS